jgi:hypothetical protein
MLKFVKIILSVRLGLAEYPYGHMSSTKKLYGRTGEISGQYRFFAVDFFLSSSPLECDAGTRDSPPMRRPGPGLSAVEGWGFAG